MTIDTSLTNAEALINDVAPRLSEILTEQDARLQLINRFLIEVCGWTYPDVNTETHTKSGYTDYLVSGRGQRRLVVEAKRIGTLIDSLAAGAKTYRVNSPALKSATEGIEQAARYCLDHGVNLAAVTNGVAWVIFRPFPAPGIPYSESNAFVFPNHQSILDNFARFYDLLAKESVISGTHTLRFAKEGGLSLAEFEPLLSANRTDDARLLAQTELAKDLEPIFREFFGAMSAENDREMLIECFVETRESRYADASLEKLLTSITTSISELATSESQLEKQIANSIETGRGADIVIIGNSGAGKSTFLERFFDSVLERTVREKCLLVRIDLSKAAIDLPTLNSFLTTALKATLERLLYSGDGPTFEQLQGLYFPEYQRRSRGQFKPLYEKDKEAFKIDFGQFLNQKLEDEPYVYVLRMLSNVATSRKMLPCVIFDNTDNLPDSRLQEAVFQYAHALRESVPYSLVVTPITDRSFWRLSKQGPFQAYQSKKYYLPVPPTKAVLEKRVEYLKRKVADTGERHQYFLTRGIRLSVENINAFAACLEETFLREDFVSRRISWLANNNIRKSLELAQQVIMSPFFSVDDLIKTYIVYGPETYIRPHSQKFMKALILGDYNLYQADKNEFVTNVFETTPHAPTTPLINLSMLKILIDRAGDSAGASAYMSVEQIRQYFEACGLLEAATNQSITDLLANGLIEPYDTSKETVESSERVAITHSGRMHFEMATSDPIFVSQMAFATPLRDMDLVERLRSFRDRPLGAEEWRLIEKMFFEYVLGDDDNYCRLPQDEMFDGQRQLRLMLKSRWVEYRANVKDATSRSDNVAQPSMGYSHIPAVMKWYNVGKSYGFAEAGLGEDVFIHGSLLQQVGIQELYTGDTLICDIVVTQQGRLQAIAVHSIERGVATSGTKKSGGRVVEGRVQFYNPAKAFGFIRSSVLDEDIYFSAKALERGGLRTIEPDAAVWARVEPGRFGRGLAATVVAKAPIVEEAV